tara:strand:- start:3380 stop:6496 length:3117 start_codon:yes stop_codon:yes gene_type:complete
MKYQTGIMAWFARRPVYVNLLMAFLIIGGLFSTLTINKEVLPNKISNMVSIEVSYDGASPQEIESGIVNKVEQALKNINAIKSTQSQSSEGTGRIYATLKTDADKKEALDEIKQQVDQISDFPAEAETPKVKLEKWKILSIIIGLTSDLNPTAHKELAKDIKKELEQIPDMGEVYLRGQQDYEVNIFVSPEVLQEYQLSFNDISDAIKKNSKDISAGSINTDHGRITISGQGYKERGHEFEQLVIKTLPNGEPIFLSDIATIQDGFTESERYSTLNGKPSLAIGIKQIDGLDTVEIARLVKNYIKKKQNQLPEGTELVVIYDISKHVSSRLDMMSSNLFYGALFVFAMLALFLEIKLAFWVIIGLPICFLGTLFFMPLEPFGLTLNMASMFGFILVLGIIVDDAIVIGESAHQSIQKHGQSLDSIIAGAKKVAIPATFGVLTTIAAFIPMFISTGPMSSDLINLSTVVILCLIFSLIESKLILPSHLAHMRPSQPSQNKLVQYKQAFNRAFDHWVHHGFRRFITSILNMKYTVISSFFALMLISIALVVGGQVRFLFEPEMEVDETQFSLEMEDGTSRQKTLSYILEAEKALLRVKKELEQEYEQPQIVHFYTLLNSNTFAEVQVILADDDVRQITTTELENRWRAYLPQFSQVKKMTFGEAPEKKSADIGIQLTSTDVQQSQAVAELVKQELSQFPGVYEISDNLATRQDEIVLQLTAVGRSMGLSLTKLTQEVRKKIYGTEVLSLLRDEETVKVMLRYPKKARQSLADIQHMDIQISADQFVPLTRVATLKLQPALTSISHINGMQSIRVDAMADKSIAEPIKIINKVIDTLTPVIAKQYPEVKLDMGQDNAESQKSLYQSLQNFCIALLIIYILIAIPLQSYTQPLLIMSVIPFSLIGAVMGHFILGLPLSPLSVMGIIALSGVVVNDSLVMIDFINQAKTKDQDLKSALIDAATYRFRSIFLTSITTAGGLLPILAETSLQAQYIIPMAVSLAFGILFATLVTLCFIPALYLALDDVSKLYKWWWQPQAHKTTF